MPCTFFYVFTTPPLSTRLESSKIDLKFSGIFGFYLKRDFFFLLTCFAYLNLTQNIILHITTSLFQFTATSVLNFLLINIIPTPSSIGIFYLPWNLKCQHFLLIVVVLKRWRANLHFPYNLIYQHHLLQVFAFILFWIMHPTLSS